MRNSLLLLAALWLSGCGILLLPVKAVEVVGTTAIKAVTPDAGDME